MADHWWSMFGHWEHVLANNCLQMHLPECTIGGNPVTEYRLLQKWTAVKACGSNKDLIYFLMLWASVVLPAFLYENCIIFFISLCFLSGPATKLWLTRAAFEWFESNSISIVPFFSLRSSAILADCSNRFLSMSSHWGPSPDLQAAGHQSRRTRRHALT